MLEFFRQSIRAMVGGWNLERKSLLFLGIALIIPIGSAFWFVLSVVGEDLVMQTTRQTARDYARSAIAWEHVEDPKVISQDEARPGGAMFFTPEVLEVLRGHLVDNPYYRYELLMLDEKVQHVDLPNSRLPSTERERELLVNLEGEFRARLAAELDQGQAALLPSSAPQVDLSRETTDEEPVEQTFYEGLDGDSLYREDGPIFPEDNNSLLGSNLDVDPPEGWYVYYHAVPFPEACRGCHHRYQKSDAADIPFRVAKVQLPYRVTAVATPTTLAVMIAVGMVTVALTLFVVHWVLRRLVLNPMTHLMQVSDEISRGKTDKRANIDTGDEFNELADAFNRMLRSLTESQETLQKLNSELDLRVDQLAQANLHLYEANRLKSDFLANMSHELRTPLNSIIGFSDVLRDITSLNDKQRKYAENIQNSGKLLLEMINDILDLAKVEAGKMEVKPTSFNLNSTVEAQCDMMRSLVDEKNMDVRFEFGELPSLFQDQSKLQQILMNLLSNAIKFTPDGGLVTISTGVIHGDRFHVTVADTGVGIPDSDLEVIFEKFRQSNAVLENGGLTRQYSGTGLGLSIVRELCKLLGGEVLLTSQLGTGSTFRIILPMHYSESTANYREAVLSE